MSSLFVFTDDAEWQAEGNTLNGVETEFQIQRFCCPVEFVSELLLHHADAVLIDLDTTGERTRKLIYIIRSIQPRLRIALMASKRDNPHLLSALSMGVFSYFLKPISSSTTEALITSAAGKR